MGRIFQIGREKGSCKSRTATGIRASGIHQDRRRSKPRRHATKTQMSVTADHADGDTGDAPEFDVVQFKIGVCVAAKEKTVFNGKAGVVGCLADLHPVLLDGSGNKIEGREAKAEHDSD